MKIIKQNPENIRKHIQLQAKEDCDLKDTLDMLQKCDELGYECYEILDSDALVAAIGIIHSKIVADAVEIKMVLYLSYKNKKFSDATLAYATFEKAMDLVIRFFLSKFNKVYVISDYRECYDSGQIYQAFANANCTETWLDDVSQINSLGLSSDEIDLVKRIAMKRLGLKDISHPSDQKSMFSFWHKNIFKMTDAQFAKKQEEEFDALVSKYKILDQIEEDLKCALASSEDYVDCIAIAQSAVEKCVGATGDDIGEKVGWWDKISKHMYKAIVSRQYTLSHPIKTKVIVEQIYKIFQNMMRLKVTPDGSKTKTAKKIADIVRKLDPEEEFLDEASADELCRYLQCCLLSFCYTDEDGYICDSGSADAVFSKVEDLKVSEDDNQKLIACISKAIDVMHVRGSLAGAFVEGGEKTCNEVSNMKAGYYESLWQKQLLARFQRLILS